MSEKVLEILDSSFGLGINAVYSSIVGVILFLIVGIILVIFCAKKNLFKRKNKFWNIATKLYYVYIPVVIAIFGAINGGIYGLKKAVNRIIEEQSSELMAVIIPEMPDFQKHLQETIGSTNLVEFSTKDIIDEYFDSEDAEEEDDKGMFDKIYDKATKWVFEGTFNGLISHYSEKLNIDGSTAVGTVKIMRSIDFSDLDKSTARIVSKFIKKQSNSFFRGLYFSQLINLLLFLIVPIVETSLYFIIIKPNKKIIKESEIDAETDI